jgi:hypothetical protein
MAAKEIVWPVALATTRWLLTGVIVDDGAERVPVQAASTVLTTTRRAELRGRSNIDLTLKNAA